MEERADKEQAQSESDGVDKPKRKLPPPGKGMTVPEGFRHPSDKRSYFKILFGIGKD